MLKLKPHALKHLALMLVALLVTSLDLLTKSWAHAVLEPSIRQTFIPHILNLILVSNTGLAFSIANDNGVLARLLASAVFILLLYFYCQRYLFAKSMHPLLEQLGISIIIGAAAGNLLERFLYGHVTDFLEFTFIHFPVFNLADVLIDVGIGLVLISIYSKDNCPEIKNSN